jgi:putative phosphoribosyl transferase
MYENRIDAGRQLAALLREYEHRRPVVLGLPRGGIPVAFEVAASLHAPLDIFMVRKVGAPGQPELAIAAVASGDIVARNENIISYLEIDTRRLEEAIHAEQIKLLEQEKSLRRNEAPVIEGRDVIVIDDGLATGATMRVAVDALRRKQPASIIAAVPVGSTSACAAVSSVADRLICPLQPQDFVAVGSWYAEFEQVSDEEVRTLLARAHQKEKEKAFG